MIDNFRDRYAVFQFIATLSDLNKNKLTPPFLKLVKKLSGVYVFNDLLYYYNLIDNYNKNKNKNSDQDMLKIFNFISDSLYFYYPDDSISYPGTVLKDIYSINSRMNLHNYERLSGINTDLNIEYPDEWCHMNKITESGKITSLNTTKKLGKKKVLFHDFDFMNNKSFSFLLSYTE